MIESFRLVSRSQQRRSGCMVLLDSFLSLLGLCWVFSLLRAGAWLVVASLATTSARNNMEVEHQPARATVTRMHLVHGPQRKRSISSKNSERRSHTSTSFERPTQRRERQTDRQMDRQTDRQAGRQTETERRTEQDRESRTTSQRAWPFTFCEIEPHSCLWHWTRSGSQR